MKPLNEEKPSACLVVESRVKVRGQGQASLFMFTLSSLTYLPRPAEAEGSEGVMRKVGFKHMKQS